jgi:hypothetical protein
MQSISCFSRHYSVNACLMPVLAADGCHVTTIQGIGTVKGDNLHPIQKTMVEMHGSQCGTSRLPHELVASLPFVHAVVISQFPHWIRFLHARHYRRDLFHFCKQCNH